MDPGQYAEAWMEFSRRMDPGKYVKFAECFHRLIQGTNVDKAESMVTVGIGNAEFEPLILERSLPNIKHVIAVKPDVKFNDKIIKALSPPDGRTIKVEVDNGVLQTYKGPDTSVDLILLANMMNYIADSAEHEVSRCLQWLKPGGHLLIVGRKWTHMDTVSSTMRAENFLPVFDEEKLCKDMKLNYKEDKAEVLFDLHEEGLRNCLYCTLNRVPSQEQVEEFLKNMDGHFLPGSKKIYPTCHFYLISK